MRFPSDFICASPVYGTLEHPVPAPCFRRAFFADTACIARLTIGAAGFYELFLNGERVTKGRLAPYISNTDDLLYYDRYELPLVAGENVVGVLLGNGLRNNPGGYIWDFDKAAFRGAPCFALSLTYRDRAGEKQICSDPQFLTAPSPIRFDDYRFGEQYDARCETPGWASPGFDASGWAPAQPIAAPPGEARLCTAEPIAVEKELHPVSVTPFADGYCYDFGRNRAGVCRLSLRNPTAGQRVTLTHVEDRLPDGSPDVVGIWFYRELLQRDLAFVHRDVYTAAGRAQETYTPTFVYHGFRYVFVTGVTPQQATADLLTYQVLHSDLRECGGFSCSDETVNRIQENVRASDLSNFFYFPTDCPHREKNGWTGDAQLSCEHMLLNLRVEASLREWLRSVVKAQNEAGALPGIVPTGGWGFGWGNGPAWDLALVTIPYLLLRYRGDLRPAAEAADAIDRYLRYLAGRVDEKGLLHIGLGDWTQPYRASADHDAPLAFTDTVLSMDFADKAAHLFDRLRLYERAAFARAFYAALRKAVRTHLLDPDACLAAGDCQTTQAMALYYGIFEPAERDAAFAHLLRQIERADGQALTGVLGERVIFHVLTDFGRSDLALHMIARPDGPSHGCMVAHGATSVWESFEAPGSPRSERGVASQNHHFRGDVSGWFLQALGGIRLNPDCTDVNYLELRPAFPAALTSVSAFHDAPAGRISVDWTRRGGQIELRVSSPAAMTGVIQPEAGWRFADGGATRPLQTGRFLLVPCE